MREVVSRILSVDDRAGQPENQSGGKKARDAPRQPACNPADERCSDPTAEMAPGQIAMDKGVLQSPIDAGNVLIEAPRHKGDDFFHTLYDNLETPEFSDDLYLRFINSDTPNKLLLCSVLSSDGRTYWILGERSL